MLTLAGLQVPVTEFVEIDGNVGAGDPLQMAGMGLKVGILGGLTVMVTVIGVPVQPAAKGVTV